MKRFGRYLLGLLVVLLLGSWGEADRLLIHCPRALRPGMVEWVAWRESQGHSIEYLEDSRLDQIATATPKPATSSRTVLLLIGDGTQAGMRPGRVPASVISAYGPEDTIASDHVLATSIGAESVARLPFNNAGSLQRFLRRAKQRSEAPARWGTTRLQIVAGAGGFSPWIDAAIEGAAKRLLGDLTPRHRRLSLTRVDASQPMSKVASPVSDTGGVWVWLGHGLRDRLPGIAALRVPTLTNGADVAVLLACYTGDVEAPGMAVAEQMLASPNGPLAVVASTRVSMPYGNARLGAEMLVERGRGTTISRQFATARLKSLEETDDPRLNGLDQLAKCLGGRGDFLKQERWEHAQMYHLYGDPFTRFDRSVALALAVDKPNPEGLVAVRGVAPFDGELSARALGAVTSTNVASPSVRTVRQGEAFTVSLALPTSDRPGRRTIWVGIQGEDAFAAGASRFRLPKAAGLRVASREPKTEAATTQ